MPGPTGDPGSTSVLGGALRGHALRLADLTAELEAPIRRTVRHGGSDPTGWERDLLERAAEELDRIGALLQALATESVENARRRHSLDAAAAADGLVVEGRHIVEAPGPKRVDPTARLRSREHLQDLLSRVTSAEGRDFARLTREVTASAATLAQVAARARTGISEEP